MNQPVEEVTAHADTITWLSKGKALFSDNINELRDNFSENVFKKEDNSKDKKSNDTKVFTDNRNKDDIRTKSNSSEYLGNYRFNLKVILSLIFRFFYYGFKSTSRITLFIYMLSFVCYYSIFCFFSSFIKEKIKVLIESENVTIILIGLIASGAILGVFTLLLSLFTATRIKLTFFKDTKILQCEYKHGAVSLTELIFSSFISCVASTFLLFFLVVSPLSIITFKGFFIIISFYSIVILVQSSFIFFEQDLLGYFLPFNYLIILAIVCSCFIIDEIPYIKDRRLIPEIIINFLKIFPPIFIVYKIVVSMTYIGVCDFMKANQRKVFHKQLFKFCFSDFNTKFVLTDKYFYLFMAISMIYLINLIAFGFCNLKKKLGISYRYKLEKK